MKAWVGSPHNLGVALHICNPRTQEIGAKRSVILGCITRSGLAWATYQKIERREEERRGRETEKERGRRGGGGEKELERGKEGKREGEREGRKGDGGEDTMEFPPFGSVISKSFPLIFVGIFSDSGPVL